jgi:D-methionine transport system ATP-binding protein
MMGSLIINIDEKDLQAVENYLDQEKITWEEIV